MPSPIRTVAPLRVAGGVVVALAAVTLVGLGYYRPSPVVGVAIALLVLALVARGLLPFGNTTAYHVLQAVSFAFWGLTVTLTEEPTVVSVVFAVAGLVGTLYYGRRAIRRGVWAPVGQ